MCNKPCLTNASDASFFAVIPESTIVYHGDDTQLNCTFKDILTNKAWLHETGRVTIGEVIEESAEHYGLIIDGNAYNLQVYNATSNVSGTYTCESQRRKSIASSADLYVIDDVPHCSVSPNPTVIEGHVTVFRCVIDLPDKAPGYLVWLKRGEEYSRGETNNATLITKLEKSDNGAEFDCQFRHKTLPRSRWSTISCAEKIVVNVQYGPRVSVVTVGNSTVPEGRSVTARCSSIDANPGEIAEVNWKSPNGCLISQHETLFLESLTRHDSGEYTCYMSNVFYNGEKDTGQASVHVDVQYMSSVTIIVNPSTNITEDDGVTFHCKAENGNPNPYRMTLSRGEKYIIHEDGPNLQHTINGVKGSDSGIYKCVALTNFNDGSLEFSFAEQKLTVHYSPKPASVSTTHYTADIYDIVTLTCEVYGFPTPTLTWQDPKGGLMSHNDKQRHVIEERDGNNVTSMLLIFVADGFYYGTYTCKAANGILPNLTQNMEIVNTDKDLIILVFVLAVIANVVMVAVFTGIYLKRRKNDIKSYLRYLQDFFNPRMKSTPDPIEGSQHRKVTGNAKLLKPLLSNKGREKSVLHEDNSASDAEHEDDRFDPGSTECQREREALTDVADDNEKDASKREPDSNFQNRHKTYEELNIMDSRSKCQRKPPSGKMKDLCTWQ